MTAPKAPRVRYGIGEWYGRPFLGMTAPERVEQANIALHRSEETLSCRFQSGGPPCSKAGGVCSIQQYAESAVGDLGAPVGAPVVVCPKRFEEEHLLLRWLAEIVGFAWDETLMAREVPFMESRSTGKPAGKIDLVVARTGSGSLNWYGLEIQAVYFSGAAMASEFESVLENPQVPRFPASIRRPDWRSSSAKRLMPQLQVKVPTLRRWGSKLAVAVDRPFFDVLGGPSDKPSQDLDDGDIIWLVPELVQDEEGGYRMAQGHWEVLTLEESSAKLLAAETVSRRSFEETLRGKLSSPVSGP